jgi:hypothetical protein
MKPERWREVQAAYLDVVARDPAVRLGFIEQTWFDVIQNSPGLAELRSDPVFQAKVNP